MSESVTCPSCSAPVDVVVAPNISSFPDLVPSDRLTLEPCGHHTTDAELWPVRDDA